ncbi:MAG TPA: radical SAM protein [Bryobacteraceae bacterium]|nr:radical SAM protein [Bryobacteraceae bacterium]
MTKRDLLPVWGRVLQGTRPFLSLELTKECPLHCPGCYAYSPGHLGDGTVLRQLSDFRGRELVSRTLDLVRRLRPVHISIVGGEPLVRYRELTEILPRLAEMRIEVQLVTSAVRPIPADWARLTNLHLAVSVDGLQPEHDRRRAPATYPRILQHIAGHRIRVHCTVTRQMAHRAGYLAEFARYWSARPEVLKIWFSLYTPQDGEISEERLRPEDRDQVIRDLAALTRSFPKVEAPQAVLRGYARPPRSPEECIFAQLTTCVSADLESVLTPCQLGGSPVCSECGCLASAAMTSVGRRRLAGFIRVSDILDVSRKIGSLAYA